MDSRGVTYMGRRSFLTWFLKAMCSLGRLRERRSPGSSKGHLVHILKKLRTWNETLFCHRWKTSSLFSILTRAVESFFRSFLLAGAILTRSVPCPKAESTKGGQFCILRYRISEPSFPSFLLIFPKRTWREKKKRIPPMFLIPNAS